MDFKQVQRMLTSWKFDIPPSTPHSLFLVAIGPYHASAFPVRRRFYSQDRADCLYTFYSG